MIEALQLNDNKMNGKVPDFLSNLSFLIRLRLQNNSFEESFSSGWLSSSSVQLSVDFNDIAGTINQKICSEILDLTVDCYANGNKCSCCTNCPLG